MSEVGRRSTVALKRKYKYQGQSSILAHSLKSREHKSSLPALVLSSYFRLASISELTMATEFSSTIEAALAKEEIAGGAAIAVDKTGKTLFSKAFGKTAVDSTTAKPFDFDTTLWIASSSKLFTSISALQCVERGLLSLDAPISDILPEWKEPQIITGFDGDDEGSGNGKATFKPVEGAITLRRLLTHSSGMTYYGMHPLVTRWRDSLGLETQQGDIETFRNPLVYEPGQGWAYGVSIDWAGQMVEKASGMRLGEWMKENIFDVLGMKSTTFKPTGDEAVMSRMVGRVGRSETGKLIVEESKQYPVQESKSDLGGSGLYSCAEDYIKVLTSLLMDDGKLLKKDGDMYKQLFRPQLEHPEAFDGAVKHPLLGPFFAPGYPRTPDTQWDYALGGAVVVKEIPGHAAKGTLFWSGLPNNYWFVDRENGVCGYYASWLLPPGDAITGKMFAALQRAAVKEVAKL